MNLVPQSERLTYEVLNSKNFESFHSLLQDAHVREFVMEGEEVSLEDSRAFMAAGDLLKEKTQLGLYLTSLNHQVIGYCGYMETVPPSDDLDVAYMFPKEFTGQGYATEVCKALVQFAENGNFAGALTAVVNPENKASIKVLEKSGFHIEGFCVGELSHLLKYRVKNV